MALKLLCNTLGHMHWLYPLALPSFNELESKFLGLFARVELTQRRFLIHACELWHESLAFIKYSNSSPLGSLAAITRYIAVIDYLFQYILRYRWIDPIRRHIKLLTTRSPILASTRGLLALLQLNRDFLALWSPPSRERVLLERSVLMHNV